MWSCGRGQIESQSGRCLRRCAKIRLIVVRLIVIRQRMIRLTASLPWSEAAAVGVVLRSSPRVGFRQIIHLFYHNISTCAWATVR
jgi:hypothetical protein